jgi:hypothetical protein
MESPPGIHPSPIQPGVRSALPDGEGDGFPRWPALAAEREAITQLIAQTQSLRRRLVAIVAEAKSRLCVPHEVELDIHLLTGLWFRVGDPMPTPEESKAAADHSV